MAGRAVRLDCATRPGLESVGSLRRCQLSQGLHRHLLSVRGSPGSCAAGLTRAAGQQGVGRSDTTRGAQVSAGSLLPGALALPARELSAG